MKAINEYEPFSTERRLVKVKSNRTVRVRRPVRADVDVMLRRLLEVEEHVASEDTEERRAAEDLKHGRWHERRPEDVVQDREYRARYGAGKQESEKRTHEELYTRCSVLTARNRMLDP